MVPNEDPNNLNGNPAPTHINAFYADLAQAEKDVAEANGRVEAAKAAIVANGGTLPDASADAADVVVAGDEAQLKEDEAVDQAGDATEVPESDAPDAASNESETPAEEANEPTEEAVDPEATEPAENDGDADDSVAAAPAA